MIGVYSVCVVCVRVLCMYVLVFGCRANNQNHQLMLLKRERDGNGTKMSERDKELRTFCDAIKLSVRINNDPTVYKMYAVVHVMFTVIKVQG